MMASPQQATAVAAAAVAESHAAQQQQSQGQHSSQPAPLKLENLDQNSTGSTSSSSGAASSAQNASTASASPTGQMQTCKWSSPPCREVFSSPDELYNHLTEVHVGRKSNNNLNLTCRWEQCNTTVIKRDHITSHLRVHVALKPHTCPKCQKSFKRPQDLKKHIKTHADDSGANQGHGAATAYGPMPSAGPGNANGFYPSAMSNGGLNSFPFSQGSNGHYPNYAQTNASIHSGFTQGNYWSPQAGHAAPQQTSFTLQGLLSANRAHDFNTNDYSSWRNHLDPVFEPIHHQSYGMGGGHGDGVAVAQPYQNPHELAASLRSKSDLSQVHAMLKEMHQAALNQQPHHGFGSPGIGSHLDRASGSPDMRSPASSAMHYSSRSTTSPTPSLTPGSSIGSYAHSPAHEYAVPSTQAPAVSYPNLSGINAGPVGAALGAQYEHDNFRRHEHRLGAGQGQRDTPKSEGSSDSDSALDPQLRNSASSADTSRDDASSREQSATPTPRPSSPNESVRLSQRISLLDSWITAIQERLEKGDFESKEDADAEARPESEDQEMTDAPEDEKKPVKAEPEPSSSANPIYPPLPMSD